MTPIKAETTDGETVELKRGEVNTIDRGSGDPVDVPGHRFDVRDDLLPLTLEGGAILTDSNMRSDPVEGTHGSYTVVLPDEECPNCGFNGIEQTVLTLAGQAWEQCMVCNWGRES